MLAGPAAGALWIARELEKPRQSFGRIYGRVFAFLFIVKGSALFIIWATPEVLRPVVQTFSMIVLAPEMFILPAVSEIRTYTAEQWLNSMLIMSLGSSLIIPAILVGWKLSNHSLDRPAAR